MSSDPESPSIVKAPDGSVHMVAQGAWTAEHQRVWASGQATSLGYDPAGGDLDFLVSLPGLRSLHVAGVCADDSAVQGCHGLETLSLHTDCAGPLDLTGLPRLADLSLEGRVRPEKIAELPALTTLHYMNWPAASLSPLLRSQTLISVRIDGMRRAKALNPDRERSALRTLSASLARGTFELVGLEEISDLKSLSFERIKIADFEPIGELTQLRDLGLVGCGAMPHIRWITKAAELRHVALHGTVIEDGDLSPLDNLPHIKTRYVEPKRYYNRRFIDAVSADEL